MWPKSTLAITGIQSSSFLFFMILTSLSWVAFEPFWNLHTRIHFTFGKSGKRTSDCKSRSNVGIEAPLQSSIKRIESVRSGKYSVHLRRAKEFIFPYKMVHFASHSLIIQKPVLLTIFWSFAGIYQTLSLHSLLGNTSYSSE